MKTYPRLESLAEMLSPVLSEKLLQQIPAGDDGNYSGDQDSGRKEISLVFPDRIALLSKVTGRNGAAPVSHQQLEKPLLHCANIRSIPICRKFKMDLSPHRKDTGSGLVELLSSRMER